MRFSKRNGLRLALLAPGAIAATLVISAPGGMSPSASGSASPARPPKPATGSPQSLTTATDHACNNMTHGKAGTVLEGILGVAEGSRPELGRAGHRLSLTCSFSGKGKRASDLVTVTMISGRISQEKFTRLATYGVRPKPSVIEGPKSTLTWEWAPEFPEGGVLSILHRHRAMVVQVLVRGASKHYLRREALALLQALYPSAV